MDSCDWLVSIFGLAVSGFFVFMHPSVKRHVEFFSSALIAGTFVYSQIYFAFGALIAMLLVCAQAYMAR